MRLTTNTLRLVLSLIVLLGCFLAPSQAEAATVMVQTTGGTAFNIAGANAISVLVTNPVDGTPISNLASNGVGLPTGWNLYGAGTLRNTCTFTVSTASFTNMGNGIYTFSNVASCSTNEDELFYVVEINVTVGGITYRGSGLGALTRGH
jgi:hypothetical protein